MPSAAAPVVPAIPFTQAAHEHVEPFTQTFTVTPGASAQVFETTVPSYGYLRHIFLQVDGAGGAAGTLKTDPDTIFQLFDAITLLDTNGAPIFGPLDGYATLLTNMLGGYAFQNNPRNGPGFVGTTPNLVYNLRIPVEIAHHNGLGSLANQNAAAAYKVRFTVNPVATVWSVAPTTVPTFTIRLALEAWSLPNEVDALGRPQAQVPPNHGTIQYWSQTKPQIVAGNNFTQITRVGNLIRNLAFIGRTSAPAMSFTVLPDPLIVSWDARQLINETQRYRRVVQWERLLGAPVPDDAGVVMYSFSHDDDNHSGDDNPTLWLPTVQATRLELDGNSAAGGTVQILVNDVAPVALDQSQRYVETAGTGFHPNSDQTPAGR